MSGSQTQRVRVDWDALFSHEAKRKQLPSLHGIVSRYTKEPDVIGMHGGLPPASTFPFTWFHSGLQPLSDASDGTAAAADAAAAAKAAAPTAEMLSIEDPRLVAAAQQYNMNAQGYAPLVAWARDLVVSMHQPATLHSSSSSSSANAGHHTQQHQQQQQDPQQPHHDPHQPQPQEQGHEPIGMDVVITPGASAALDSLVRVLVNPGDPVLVEEYTYAHMAEAHLLPLGCELLPMPLDEGGLVPSAVDELLTARQAAGLPMPKLLYTIPTGQNPTGSVMSHARMAEVYRLARKWGLVIIEDDAYYFLQYPDGPDNVPGLDLRPGFLHLDVDGRVVRVDTLAKLLGPGFRLGWLSGPPALVSKVGLYMAGISIGANMVSQVMLHELLANTWGRSGFEAFVRRLQAQYARQAGVAAAAAEAQLGGLAEWGPARAGMFMWLKLTGDVDSESLIEAAAASKVMVVPGHLISVAHLQAAHRKKQAAAAAVTAAAVGATLSPPQQTQQQAAPAAAGSQQQVLAAAAELAALTQQLQQHTADAASQPAGGQGAGANAAVGPVTVCSSSSNCSSGSGLDSLAQQLAAITQRLQAAAAPAEQQQQVQPQPQACPHFRISFVSVPPEAIREGFARLRCAILSLHGPKTPPGEESEMASCSSSVGSLGGRPSGTAAPHCAAGGGGGGGGGAGAACCPPASADAALC